MKYIFPSQIQKVAWRWNSDKPDRSNSIFIFNSQQLLLSVGCCWWIEGVTPPPRPLHDSKLNCRGWSGLHLCPSQTIRHWLRSTPTQRFNKGKMMIDWKGDCHLFPAPVIGLSLWLFVQIRDSWRSVFIKLYLASLWGSDKLQGFKECWDQLHFFCTEKF